MGMSGFTKSIGGERGKSKLATLIILAGIIAVIYGGLQFVPPVVDYLKMKNIAYDVMTSVGDKGNDAILERLFRMARQAGIEITPENVTIEKEESGPATLIVDYSETVVLIKDKLEKTLNFHIEETAR
jgi:hypothetical protein